MGYTIVFALDTCRMELWMVSDIVWEMVQDPVSLENIRCSVPPSVCEIA